MYMSDIKSELKNLRQQLADAEGVELYRVFQNATIDEICAKLPKTNEELLAIKGMGEKKVQKYGARIFKVVNGVGGSGLDSFANTTPEVGATSVAPAEDEAFVEDVGAGNKQMVSVSEYIEYLNLVLQKTADVKIVGEVSASKLYPSGLYFTLKDKNDESVLSCYMPTYTYRGMGILLEDGMEVSVEGVPRLVKRNGRFQITVENLQLVGEGALKKAYEQLKNKFSAEGLFDRKRELPEFVQSVGVITSRAGAVIHDFRNNLAKLGIAVYLKDVRVEGASSADMVIEAIRWFNEVPVSIQGQVATKQTGAKKRESEIATLLRGGAARNDKAMVDVVVVMRGGGSLEDMQAFNTEAVVRAVFGSKIPTIVSIGHDKDVPLAQLAADIMVSTPTAAAHAVSQTWQRLFDDLPRLQTELVHLGDVNMQRVKTQFQLHTQAVLGWCSRLSQSYRATRDALVSHVDRYKNWIAQTRTAVTERLERIVQLQSAARVQLVNRIDAVEAVLEQGNPERLLQLGYSIAHTEKGTVVRSVADVGLGEDLHVQVRDGVIHTTVRE